MSERAEQIRLLNSLEYYGNTATTYGNSWRREFMRQLREKYGMPETVEELTTATTCLVAVRTMPSVLAAAGLWEEPLDYWLPEVNVSHGAASGVSYVEAVWHPLEQFEWGFTVSAYGDEKAVYCIPTGRFVEDGIQDVAAAWELQLAATSGILRGTKH